MTRFTIGAIALAAGLALAACQQEPEPDPMTAGPDARIDERTDPPAGTPPTPAEAERRPLVALSDTEPAHLVDAAGQALYVLEGNEDGSRCDAECENAWPPVQAEASQPIAGQGGVAGELSTMPRADGGLHVTYNGQPLYRYAADSGVGATAGDGVQDQWGTWSLVTADQSAQDQ